MTGDIALLRQYSQDNSKEPFAELINRHLNLVYSVSRRASRDRQLAEGIAQVTFVILARKSAALPEGTLLPVWLCHTARQVTLALNKNRPGRRRAQKRASLPAAHQSEYEAWEEIERHLENGLARLPEKDHTALVLRFFEKMDLPAVAAAMHLSAAAANSYVAHGLANLKDYFTKFDLDVTADALAAALEKRGVHSAPEPLAEKVLAGVMNESTLPGWTAHLVDNALKHMNFAPWRWIGISAAAILCLGIAAGLFVLAQKTLLNPGNHADTLELPQAVRAPLAKQQAALRNVYLEYTQSQTGTLRTDISATYGTYFDANRIYQRDLTSGPDAGQAFDGRNFWQSDGTRPAQMTSFNGMSDEIRYGNTFNFEYISACGIYAPTYTWETENFTALEPMALYYLQNNQSMKIERVGANVRLTCEVTDATIATVWRIDLHHYQKSMESRSTASVQQVAERLAYLRNLQAMKPTRKVMLLLDATHGYGVSQRDEWTAAGDLIAHFDCTDWKYYPNVEISLPAKCVATYYRHPVWLNQASPDKKPVLTVTHELKLAQFEHKNFSFTLENKAATSSPAAK